MARRVQEVAAWAAGLVRRPRPGGGPTLSVVVVRILFVSNETPPCPIEDDAGQLETLLPEIRGIVAVRRDAELRLAHRLARLADGRLWEKLGCANVGEFGERVGIAAPEARALVDLGRALRRHPDLEDEVRRGEVTSASAGCVAGVLIEPEMLRPDDDWRYWARTDSLRTLGTCEETAFARFSGPEPPENPLGVRALRSRASRP